MSVGDLVQMPSGNIGVSTTGNVLTVSADGLDCCCERVLCYQLYTLCDPCEGDDLQIPCDTGDPEALPEVIQIGIYCYIKDGASATEPYPDVTVYRGAYDEFIGTCEECTPDYYIFVQMPGSPSGTGTISECCDIPDTCVNPIYVLQSDFDTEFGGSPISGGTYLLVTTQLCYEPELVAQNCLDCPESEDQIVSAEDMFFIATGTAGCQNAPCCLSCPAGSIVDLICDDLYTLEFNGDICECIVPITQAATVSATSWGTGPPPFTCGDITFPASQFVVNCVMISPTIGRYSISHPSLCGCNTLFGPFVGPGNVCPVGSYVSSDGCTAIIS